MRPIAPPTTLMKNQSPPSWPGRVARTMERTVVPTPAITTSQSPRPPQGIRNSCTPSGPRRRSTGTARKRYTYGMKYTMIVVSTRTR